MADIKLYNIKGGNAQINTPLDLKYEREIQALCEKNLDVFFSIRFLASEYSTGNKHKGRIDTLGIDENNCPVIIEYKLDSKENVINQGLFYLDWLMDHQADFELMCMKQKQLPAGQEVDWTNPRLLCIAKDFTRYDDYAIGQINRNIELIRYRLFDGDHIIFELAGAVQKQSSNTTISGTPAKYRDMDDAINAASDDLLNLYQALEDYINSLGDDVQKKELKYYHAFSRIKNFVCVELRTKKKEIFLFLKISYNSIQSPTSNMRDVSNIGHYGTGDTEIVIKTLDELEAVKNLIEESYNNS
jgi:predicted transport protein